MSIGGGVTERGGHLEYYMDHGISPVHYDVSNLDAHLERRSALYTTLGLAPVAFRNVNVLEVAPGSGQNSLYVSSLKPASYHLVEPNPQAVRDIRQAYADFHLLHTPPQINAGRFEAFQTDAPFDIVLCENWLGHLPRERDLMRKLSGLVAPGGSLVVTFVPPAGFAANVVRRVLADKLVSPIDSLETKVTTLLEAFSPHLATLPDMTRSHRDWILDCMINPHYLNVVLPIEMVIEDIGPDFEVTGANPCFRVDWRWFKSLHGDARRLTENYTDAYLGNLHNFIDHRRVLPAGDASENASLAAAAWRLHGAAVEFERAYRAHDSLDTASAEVAGAVRALANAVAGTDASYADALSEAAVLVAQDHPTAAAVAEMKRFAPLFGRETVYLAMTRTSVSKDTS